jgi:membrane-associated protease RseP (regulator of RpoE activity)
MNVMQRCGSGLVGALLLVGAASAAADAKAPDHPAPAVGDEARLERQLEAAQKRLEQAAKEVAELSAGLVPAKMQEIQIRLGEPRAMLGVQLGEGRAGGGVRVAGVSPGGPAAEAGVKPGDVVLSVNGHRTAAAADVSHEVHGLKPGEEAQLELERGGKVERVVVVTRPLDPRLMLLGGDLLDGRLLESLGGMGDGWRWGGGWGELELAALSPDLGRYFGADRGVLVIRAPADGSLKLKDGDVITAIDGREPQGVAHALRILRSYQPGEHVTLSILRDRKPQKLDLAMPARPAPDGRAPPRPPRAPPAPPAAPAPPTPPVPAAPPPPQGSAA